MRSPRYQDVIIAITVLVPGSYVIAVMKQGGSVMAPLDSKVGQVLVVDLRNMRGTPAKP